MQSTEFIPDADDLAILAFRLAWPGEAAAATPAETRRRLRPIPGHAKLARLIPAALRNRLARRKLALHGWPVTLSVPSPDNGRSWLPSVKITGKPLD